MTNKKRLLPLLLTLALLAALLTGLTVTAAAEDAVDKWSDSLASAYESGTGTEGDPYMIADGAQLALLADTVNNTTEHYSGKYFMLACDIDLGDKLWTPIGKNKTSPITGSDNYFAGVFDGGNHTISGLNASGTNSVGLFGFVKAMDNEADAVIKNLRVQGTVSSEGSYAAGVIAQAVGNVTIQNVGSEVDVTATGSNVGGVIGRLDKSTTTGTTLVDGCYNKGSVTITGQGLGGVIGLTGWSKTVGTFTVRDCYNIGSIETSYTNTGTATCPGGIIGNTYNAKSITVQNCFNAGTVTWAATSGNYQPGGIIGYVGSSTKLTGNYYLTQCYYRGGVIKTARPCGSSGLAKYPGTGINSKEETLTNTLMGDSYSSIPQYSHVKIDGTDTYILVPRLNWEIGEGHEHSWNLVEQKPVSCTEDGSNVYYACTCGLFSSDADTNIINPNSWITETAPGHLYGETYTIDDNNTHSQTCSECQYKDIKAHEWQNGECTVCGAKHEHGELTKTDAVAPTCTTAGNDAYWYCEGCNTYFSDEKGTEVIEKDSWNKDPLGHDYTVLKDNGNGTHSKHCLRCNAEEPGGWRVDPTPLTSMEKGKSYIIVDTKSNLALTSADSEKQTAIRQADPYTAGETPAKNMIWTYTAEGYLEQNGQYLLASGSMTLPFGKGAADGSDILIWLPEMVHDETYNVMLLKVSNEITMNKTKPDMLNFMASSKNAMLSGMSAVTSANFLADVRLYKAENVPAATAHTYVNHVCECGATEPIEITIGDGTLTAAGTVDLPVSISGNPGFGALKMTFTLPGGLKYAATDPVTASEALAQKGGYAELGKDGQIGVILEEDYTNDDPLFTLHLTGTVAEGGEAVTATINTFGNETTTLTATVKSGTVTPHAHDFNTDNGFCKSDDALNSTADTYIVTNADQLHAVAMAVNGGNDLTGKTVELANNIDLSAYKNWEPIGNGSQAEENQMLFAGTFDGQNKTISGLTINKTENKAEYMGLFGCSSGTIQNFTISGTITYTASSLDNAGDYIAGAVGLNSGKISGVTNQVTITAVNGCNVGGIAGRTLAAGSIENCLNEAAITGTKKTGGICGSLWGGTITACANTGNITGNGDKKDGIVGIVGMLGDSDPKGDEQGSAAWGGTVTSCYSTGKISSPNAKWIGGIAGFADKDAIATNCYTTGTVAGTGQYNPIIGQNEGTASYNYCLDSTITGDEDGIYNKGGTKEYNAALTIAEMKAHTFVDTLNEQSEAKETRWLVNCGSTPVLFWQTGKDHNYNYGVCTVCGDSRTALSAVRNGPTLTVTVSEAYANENALLFEAEYDAATGRLIAVQSKPLTGGTTTYTFTLSRTDTTVNCFLLTTDTYKPLTDAISLKAAQ